MKQTGAERQPMKRHASQPPSLRIGLMLVACGLTLGTASVVALAHALSEMVP